MTRHQLHRAVARLTGESVSTISRRGFSIVHPKQARHDPEPSRLRPQAIDWDTMQPQRLRLP
jgi:hypothetical protein